MKAKQAQEERQLGTRLAELRKRAGLSQQDLANRMNVSRQAISLWESGNGMPSIDNLLFLSDFYSVSVDYLLGRTDELPQSKASAPSEAAPPERSQKKRRTRILFAGIGALLALIALAVTLILHTRFADLPIEVTPVDNIPVRAYAISPENTSP